MVELDQVAVASVIILLLLSGAYYYYTTTQPKNVVHNKHEGLSFTVEAVSPAYARPHTSICYVGSETLPPPKSGYSITFHAAYAITNSANRPTIIPASIYLVVEDEVVQERPLPYYTYPPGGLLYNNTIEFGFDSREFTGSAFRPELTHGGKVDFNYKLIYCSDCTDPVKEGLVIYEGNTRDLCYPMQCSSISCRPN